MNQTRMTEKRLNFSMDGAGVLYLDPAGENLVVLVSTQDSQGYCCGTVYLNGRPYATVTFGIDGSRVVSSSFLGMDDNAVNNLSFDNIINAL